MDFVGELKSFLWRLSAFLLLLIAIKLARKMWCRGENRPDYTGCDDPGCVRCRRKAPRDSPEAKELCVESWRLRHWLDSRERLEKKGEVLLEMPGLRHCTPYVDGQEFHVNDVKILETNWEVIRDECMHVMTGAFNNSMGSWKINSTRGRCGAWSVFYLFNQGKELKQNSELCPETMKIIGELEGVLDNCSLGNIAFSVLLPNTTIPAHRGPTNTRTRCHLGLNIPLEVTLTVDGVESSWEEGKCLLFNDSFLHSVHYKPESSETDKLLRILLMIDLWHPDVSADERSAIKRLYPPQ